MDNENTLRMTVGELRDLAARAWGYLPGRVSINAGPGCLTVSAGPDRNGAAHILVDQRFGPLDRYDAARVIVDAAVRQLAQDIETRRGAVDSALEALRVARERLADTERLLTETEALLGDESAVPTEGT